jgi:hypothetical protein
MSRAPLCIGWVENISDRGLGLLVTEPLEAPCLLELVFLAKGMVPRQTRVVRARPHGDGWMLACVLDHPFSAEELAALTVPEIEPTAPVNAGEVSSH